MNMVAYTACKNTSDLELRLELLSSVVLTETCCFVDRNTRTNSESWKLAPSSLDGKALASNIGLQENLKRSRELTWGDTTIMITTVIW